MLITIDSIKDNSGRSQPVFSRSGQATVFQFKAFQNPTSEFGGIDHQRKQKIKPLMNTAQILRELEKIQQKVEREKQQELIKQIRQKPKSSYFKSVDREFYYNQNQKNREEFKEAGHYKPEFLLIEKKIPTQVLYDVPDVKDQIQEKLQLRQKSI